MLDNIGIGNQIAFLRKQKGFTQQELAEQLGISAQAISKWENGHTMPEAAILPMLSGLLNTSIDSMLMPATNVEYVTNIKSIEEINKIDKQKAKKILEKFDKIFIAKALKGVSPAIAEYLKDLFPDVNLTSLCNEIGSVRLTEIDSIHAQIVDAINQSM